MNPSDEGANTDDGNTDNISDDTSDDPESVGETGLLVPLEAELGAADTPAVTAPAIIAAFTVAGSGWRA
jgi:hypothetical protein